MLASLLAAYALQAAPVPPQTISAGYAFAFPGGGPRLEIAPAVGAHVSSLKMGAVELLFLDRSTHWGSTFWLSPQKTYDVSSLKEVLDRAAYTGGPGGPQGSVLILAGPKEAATGLSVSKRISADDADTSFTLTFTIRNGGTAARSVAPWQVTRMLPGGLTFFAKGPGGQSGNLLSQVKEIGGWQWFEFDTAVLPSGIPKYFADGLGWMAHVDGTGLLILETFPDLSPSQAASEEAEIEIYADPRHRYEENEHQGAYASILPGDSSSWTTRWHLRQLPPGIARKAGDPALVAYVEALLRGRVTALHEIPRIPRVSSAGRTSRVRLRLRGGNPATADAAGRRPGKWVRKSAGTGTSRAP
ncbi:MAG: hypothetical protein ABIW76_15870 [Fibrobacteria bacterium]